MAESTRQTYGARLQRVVAERGPLCAGIDPHPAMLRAWGLSTAPAGLERCARTMVEALGDVVAVFKPQSAFFEAYGSAGVAVLERTLADIAGTGALALLDVKRGDIGSTMDAYAAAYLSDGSPLAADAVTLSPYLGAGALDGAVELALQQGRGVYVLALTSNPEGPEFQLARRSDGRSVAQAVVDAAADWDAAAVVNQVGKQAGDVAGESPGEAPGDPWGSVGLVIGATVGRHDLDLSRLRGSILAPGFGAQGGTVADLARVFGPALGRVLPSTSRDLMSAGPDRDTVRARAVEVSGQLGSLAPVG